MRITFLLSLIFFIHGCSNVESKTVYGNQGASLSENERLILEGQFNAGNASALWKLIDYYQYVENNTAEGIRLLEHAKEQNIGDRLMVLEYIGNVYATGMLGYVVTKDSCKKGRSILIEACRAGSLNAETTLRSLNGNCEWVQYNSIDLDNCMAK